MNGLFATFGVGYRGCIGSKCEGAGEVGDDVLMADFFSGPSVELGCYRRPTRPVTVTGQSKTLTPKGHGAQTTERLGRTFALRRVFRARKKICRHCSSGLQRLAAPSHVGCTTEARQSEGLGSG